MAQSSGKHQEDAIEQFNETDVELAAFGQKPAVLSKLKAGKDPQSSDVWQMEIDICRSDAFTLAPVTITQGPLKGRQAFVVVPFQPFRFMDLSAELRTTILRNMLTKSKTIVISDVKAPVKQRPTKQGRSGQNTRNPHDRISTFSWDKTGKSLDLSRGPLAIARACKALSQEALSIAYASNKFGFNTTQKAFFFLESIGSMKQYFRHAMFLKDNGYSYSGSSKFFKALLPATNLRSIEITHRMLCQTNKSFGRVGLEGFASDVLPLLKAMHKSLQGRKDLAYNVLDIVKITQSEEQCSRCTKGAGKRCSYSPASRSCWHTGTCHVPCGGTEAEEHREAVEVALKAMLAKGLGIKLKVSMQLA